MCIWYKRIYPGCSGQQSACPTCSGTTSPGIALSAPSPTKSHGWEFPRQSAELWLSVSAPEGVYEWQLKWKQDHSPCAFWKAQPLYMRVTAGRALPVRYDRMCDSVKLSFLTESGKEAETETTNPRVLWALLAGRWDPAPCVSCSLFQPNLGVAVQPSACFEFWRLSANCNRTAAGPAPAPVPAPSAPAPAPRNPCRL